MSHHLGPNDPAISQVGVTVITVPGVNCCPTTSPPLNGLPSTAPTCATAPFATTFWERLSARTFVTRMLRTTLYVLFVRIPFTTVRSTFLPTLTLTVASAVPPASRHVPFRVAALAGEANANMLGTATICRDSANQPFTRNHDFSNP